MKLKKISYDSAVFFGVLTLVFYLIMGALQLILVRKLPELAMGIVSPVQTLIVAPLIGGIVGYAFTLLGILIYNNVAKYYPISWELAKK